ncbi:AAA family ATPase [Vreelandella venusta]|uniref:AAA family ATPase n=1 Tax=Vreelandella venusta TaxID=44935 RepID=UPI0011702B7C|nr:AAA family ATPase [Halomonas venusta]GEK52319.1 hypothetical protein HVE01_30400 [Halomonas venusta]
MTVAVKFADSGTRVEVLMFDDEAITSTLKPAVYSVGFHPMAGFFLKKTAPLLPVPSAVYGSTTSRVDKILAGYQGSDRSFGVLLSGDKGSGKTMTASLVANRAITELNLPVILVDDSFDPSGLSDFIQKLGECVIFFDEFGKRFDTREDEQDGLLGLFDGTGSARRLILLTENNTRKINEFMINRPGRIHYHFRHEKLEEAVVREYCLERGIPEGVIEQICLMRDSCYEFSFDVLQAVVKEYLMYPGDISELAADLNIERPLSRDGMDIQIHEVVNLNGGSKYEVAECSGSFPSRGNSAYIEVNVPERKHTLDFHIGVKNLVKREGDLYLFVVNEEGFDLCVKARAVERKFNWDI